MTTLRFLGGTDTVTGSKFLVGAGAGSVLVDCGMFQGPREVRDLNWDDPSFRKGLPDEVLITHAHIDHTGWLPRLVGTHGFGGRIVCTPATADLLQIMLPDSARLQEENAAYANKKGYSRHDPALPLYTEEDAHRTLGLLHTVPYSQWVDTPAGRARYSVAGHILGSASITLETPGGRIVFSGDVGRWDVPILKDPDPPRGGADLLLLESTYGGRHHSDEADPSAALAGLIGEVAGADGVLVIPAFSIGRTQDVLYRIRALEDEGRIPSLPVYLDSPMAIDATEVYARHVEEHDLEFAGLAASGTSPIRPDRFHLTRTVEESKDLNRRREAMVVVSASGMASGGRVPHHLKRRLPYPENVVAFVGYQAQGTLGRALVDGADRVRIHGEDVEVRARVTRVEALSAHADEDELLRWTRDVEPGRIALTHGEDEARQALAAALGSEFDAGVLVPARGDVVEV